MIQRMVMLAPNMLQAKILRLNLHIKVFAAGTTSTARTATNKIIKINGITQKTIPSVQLIRSIAKIRSKIPSQKLVMPNGIVS